MRSDDIEAQLHAEYRSQHKQSKPLDVQMLQRQVMFKQLQDLQRRQQLQELGDNRNQNFVNQLSSLKHVSVGQFSPTVNGGTPLLDSSQMSVFGNMETMPSGLVLTQNHNPDAVSPVGLSPPQFDIYGTHAPNDRKNFNQYSNLQGLSNLPVDMRTKNHSSVGVATMQQSPFGSSFMNQQFNFPSDRIRMPDGQVPIEGCNMESMSASYSHQGIPMQGNASFLKSEGGYQDADWEGFSPGKSSNLGLSGPAASLDPLEQKILYGTDDNIWESSLSSKMNTGSVQTTENASHIDALPSIQSGSWSALMLSAVEETSSSDTGMQEEWSGLSFKNPGSLNGSQLPNFIEGRKLQHNWVDRNLQNAPPPSSGMKHLFQNLNMNHSFPDFQDSGNQYGSSHATLDHFAGNTGQFDYSSQQKLPTRGMQLIHAPALSSVSQDSGFRLQATDPQPPQAYPFFPTLGSSSAAYLSGNITNDTENQHPALPVPRSMSIEFPACSSAATLQNSELKIIRSGGQEFPLVEKNLVTQPSLKSEMLQHAGLPTPWPNIATRQDASAHKPHNISNVFGFPNPASSSLEGMEHRNPKPFRHDQEFSPNTGKLEGYGQQLKQGNSLRESSSEMNNSISLGSTNTQEYEKNHHLEAGAVGSDSLVNTMQQQLSNQIDGGGNEAPSVPPGDIGAFGNSLNQNYSLVHQVHSSRNIETDGKTCPAQYDNMSLQKSHANSMEPFMSEQKSGVEDIAKSDSLAVLQVGAVFSGDVKGLNFSQETRLDESRGASLTAYRQQQVDMFGQNNTPIRSIGSIETSNVTYPSQISLQMTPSWIQHYGTLNDGNMLPICEPKSAVTAEQQFSNLQQNSLAMQVNLTQANQGSGFYPSTASTSILCQQLDSPSVVATDVTSQKLAVSVPRKRKLAEFAMVPFHKEMNHEQSGLHDISIAELIWSQTLNRRAMEVRDEADVVEEFPPPVRAKRRIICTTQLLQQVFRPMPTAILHSDASSNCGVVPYSAARLALGDACNLSGQLLEDTNDISDKPETSKRRKACEFSKVVEGFISRATKLKGDLSSITRSLSYTALKVEAQELEKFSIINRFAKIHIKAHPSTVDPSASASTVPITNVQRYVVAVPMPSTIPEGADCLSL